MIEQTVSFNEMKETLNKSVLMQNEILNRFLMKFQDMENSNIKLRGEVIHLMKDVETTKINQDKQIPLIKEHISNFNKFNETTLPSLKIGEIKRLRKNLKR